MASSRIVLSRLGGSAMVGSLSVLLIGLVTLNLLLLIVPLAVLALTATELLAFDWATRDFGPSWFRWQRFENSSEVRIDSVGSMALDLERVRPGGAYLEVFDPHPDAFEVVLGSPRLVTWWSSSTPVRLAYVYRPRQRGRFRLGPTIIVAHDPLGFAFRVTKLENRWEVLVTPTLSVEEAMAVPPGPGGPAEAYRRRVGPGTEFRSLREYQPSDDARKIAWRRSGLEKIYVREHEEEAHPDLLLLLDTGWEMRLGVPGDEALEQGVEAATIIAGQAVGESDRVALLTFADRMVEYVPPQRGPRGAEVLTEAFGRVSLAPAAFDLPAALAAAQERLAAPTVVVLFSTLLTVGGPIEGAIAALRTRGHRLVALCPELATLFPPEEDALAARTMQFARVPVEHEVDQRVQRLRDARAVVVQYPAPQLGAIAADLLAWIATGGGSA